MLQKQNKALQNNFLHAKHKQIEALQKEQHDSKNLWQAENASLEAQLKEGHLLLKNAEAAQTHSQEEVHSLQNQLKTKTEEKEQLAMENKRLLEEHSNHDKNLESLLEGSDALKQDNHALMKEMQRLKDALQEADELVLQTRNQALQVESKVSTFGKVNAFLRISLSEENGKHRAVSN